MYVKGTTRVKGVSNKNVYYVGCVESDGYIYFNDSVSYRIPTPATLTEATDINITQVQIWYTIRNCWIRANYFTSLKVYGVDFEHMYERIGTLESKVATLESKVATLESKVATLESKVATLESKVATLESKVATLESKVSQLETDMADLQIRMTAAESGITSLQNRMNTVESNITVLQSRMTSAEQNITANRNNITAINNVLGYLPNLIGQNTTLEDWLRTKFQSVDGSITTLTNNYNNLSTSLYNLTLRVTRLEDRLNNAYTGSGGGTFDMETIIDALEDGLHNVLLDIASIEARQAGHKSAINELGHKALGAIYGNTDGNGVTLLAVYDKVNTVINNVNDLIDGYTIMGHISNLPRTSVWASWSDIPQ